MPTPQEELEALCVKCNYPTKEGERVRETSVRVGTVVASYMTDGGLRTIVEWDKRDGDALYEEDSVYHFGPNTTARIEKLPSAVPTQPSPESTLPASQRLPPELAVTVPEGKILMMPPAVIRSTTSDKPVEYVKNNIRQIYSPHHKQYVTLGGRRIPKARPKLHLKDFMRRGVVIPDLPLVSDYSAKAMRALSQIYLNNELGCCVVAALTHLRGVTSGNAGPDDGSGAVIFSDNAIRTMYTGMSGGEYNPSDPSTDQGCDEQTALGYAMSTGYTDGVKTGAFVAVDATNWTEVCYAIFLFEGIMAGQCLPEAWVSPFPSPGGTWDIAGDPVPSNGHATAYMGYDFSAKTAKCATWGMLIQETAGALAAYASPAASGELYAVLNPDIIAKATAKAPNMLDYPALLAAIADPTNFATIPTPC